MDTDDQLQKHDYTLEPLMLILDHVCHPQLLMQRPNVFCIAGSRYAELEILHGAITRIPCRASFVRTFGNSGPELFLER